MIAEERLKLGVDAFAVLVAMSVAFALAGLTWRLLGEPGGPARTEPPPVGPTSLATVDIGPILAFAPFGEAYVQGAATAATSSGLVLKGLFAAGGSSRSAALIQVEGGKVESYGVGEVLPGGGVVEGVATDYVLIRVDGRLETLGFPSATATAQSAAVGPNVAGQANATTGAPAPAARSSGVAAILATIPPEVSGVARPAPVAPAPPTTPGAAVDAVRRQAADNPQALLQFMGAEATGSGYRVGSGVSADLRRAGLLPGDVIERVNGAAVGDVQRDRRTFEQAVASGRARVDVVRDGRRLSLSFPLR